MRKMKRTIQTESKRRICTTTTITERNEIVDEEPGRRAQLERRKSSIQERG
jgi:hypothetical protein